MNNYYDELELEIENLIKDEKYNEALELIESELKMPYVPMKLEEKLVELRKECQQVLNIKVDSSSLDYELIKSFILDKDETLNQAGIIELSKLNLRNHYEDIQELILKVENEIVKSMLLLLMVEQKIDGEVKLEKNGMTYLVNPIYIEHPTETEGYQIAYQFLDDLLFKEPSLRELCISLLVQQVINVLPLGYDETQGKNLGLLVYKKGLFLLNRESEWYNYMVETQTQERDSLDPLALFN